MLKVALVLVKNVFFSLKKDISGSFHWVTPKHTAILAKSSTLVADILDPYSHIYHALYTEQIICSH